MKQINEYISESMINQFFDVTMTPIEMLALYTMIDATDCAKTFERIKHKLEISLRSHITYILREYKDIANKYDYNTIFEPKSIEEANLLLDIIDSEIKYRKK